jgi:hypothetical protein
MVCFVLLNLAESIILNFTFGSWYEEDCERLLILQQLRLLNIFVVASVSPDPWLFPWTHADYV